MTLVSTSILALAIAFLVVAAIAAVASVAASAEFVVTNRTRPSGPPRVDPQLLRRLRAHPLILTRADAGPQSDRVWQHRGVRHRYECPMRWADMDLLGPHQQRGLRGLPPRGPRGHDAHPRPAEAARASWPGGHRGGPPRGDLRRRRCASASGPVSIECWVTEIRAAIVHDGLRGLPRDARRAAVRLPPGEDRADAVRLRHRAPSSAHRGERETLAPLPRAEAERAPASPSPAVRAARRPGHYPVHVRFSDVDVYGHVNNVKYFEYFQEARISAASRRLWERPRPAHDRRRPDRRRLPGADPLPARAVRRLVVGRRGSASAPPRSSRSSATATPCSSRARVVIVFFDQATQRSTEPPERLPRPARATLLTA